ncbi:uncharacterized protein LOC119173382 [Rhipicephalus microplus]|uniref:uncharacterized protein LOC119173382 n=1 Tax=Rhipicephalus microplus TaxID=6941 RepID=UPI003F6A9090
MVISSSCRNGYAVILEDKLKEHSVRPEHLLCFYKEIRRNTSNPNPDDAIAYGNRELLPLDKPFTPEFAYVECATKQSPSQTFHKQFLLNVVVKWDAEERCRNTKYTTPHNLSILVLGLDSVSYLNLDRHLPGTSQFMRRTLNAFELRGYNKIGDNTYPNLHALLTGLKYAETQKYVSEGFYDNLTSRIIWHEYGKRGYFTMFSEDWPWYGTFHRFSNGFRHPPSDYYPRHAIIALENSSKWPLPRCLGATMVCEEILDYSFRFTKIKNHFFAFVWINELTHDDLNSARYADKIFLTHLQLLHASGTLDNMVLIFLSDHGLRFGDLRSTYIGKFEDRQPFAFVAFPQWFLEQNPNAAGNLRVNQFRLTTHFDVHAMLAELLDYPNIERPQTTYGRSLLHEIPEGRTCADAHIGPHWCVCSVRSDVTVTSTLALAMADKLVSWINRLVARATRKCAEYHLLKVMDVTAIHGKPDDHAHNASNFYWITIQLSPGNAVFEGTVHVIADAMTVLSDVSRTDRCTWMSQCAWDHWLAKYCFCTRTLGLQM